MLTKLVPLIQIIAQDFIDRYADIPLKPFDQHLDEDVERRKEQLISLLEHIFRNMRPEEIAEAINEHIAQIIKELQYLDLVYALSRSVDILFGESAGAQAQDRRRTHSAMSILGEYEGALLNSRWFQEIRRTSEQHFFSTQYAQILRFAGDKDTNFSRIKVSLVLCWMSHRSEFMELLKQGQRTPLASRIEQVEELRIKFITYSILSLFCAGILIGAVAFINEKARAVYR